MILEATQFFLMLSDDRDFVTGQSDHFGAQISQAPISENHDAIGPRERYLLVDLKRCGQRFDKNCLIVADRVGNQVQVVLWDRDRFGEGAVVAIDPDHGSVATVISHAGIATGAVATVAVDFADDALAGKSPGLSDPDEFMAEDAGKVHVAA